MSERERERESRRREKNSKESTQGEMGIDLE